MKRRLVAVALCVACRPASPPASRPEVPSDAPRSKRVDPPAQISTECTTGVGVSGRIISIVAHRAATIVISIGGNDQGVDLDWSVVHPTFGCEVVVVEPTRTTLKCAGTAEQIKAVPAALLCPP